MNRAYLVADESPSYDGVQPKFESQLEVEIRQGVECGVSSLPTSMTPAENRRFKPIL